MYHVGSLSISVYLTSSNYVLIFFRQKKGRKTKYNTKVSPIFLATKRKKNSKSFSFLAEKKHTTHSSGSSNSSSGILTPPWFVLYCTLARKQGRNCYRFPLLLIRGFVRWLQHRARRFSAPLCLPVSYFQVCPVGALFNVDPALKTRQATVPF